jgi:crossover junction endodeoxyribonuclease RuvC
LGIDPGSRVTGFGVIESDGARARVVVSGSIEPRGAETFAARLLAVHEGIGALIAEHRPDEVALEDAFLAKNVRTVALISQVRGVILLAAARGGVPVFEYAPRQVKLAIVGNGAAAKPQVAKMVARLLGIEAGGGAGVGTGGGAVVAGAARRGATREMATLDESDALAIALCHAHRERARLRMTARVSV